MDSKQIKDTIKSTVWLRSADESTGGYYNDQSGQTRRWEQIVYYSQCGRFRKEYHVNKDNEQFVFQLIAEHGAEQEDMPEYSSLTELLQNYSENDGGFQMDFALEL